MLEGKKTLLQQKMIEESFAEAESLSLSFLDLICFAYLQEVVTNTPESRQAEYLKKCTNLLAFQQRMKEVLAGEKVVITPQRIEVKCISDCTRIYNQLSQKLDAQFDKSGVKVEEAKQQT